MEILKQIKIKTSASVSLVGIHLHQRHWAKATFPKCYFRFKTPKGFLLQHNLGGVFWGEEGRAAIGSAGDVGDGRRDGAGRLIPHIWHWKKCLEEGDLCLLPGAQGCCRVTGRKQGHRGGKQRDSWVGKEPRAGSAYQGWQQSCACCSNSSGRTERAGAGPGRDWAGQRSPPKSGSGQQEGTGGQRQSELSSSGTVLY